MVKLDVYGPISNLPVCYATAYSALYTVQKKVNSFAKFDVYGSVFKL
jgi:hypothetical protein